MTTRAAIYARFSSERQSERSIEDQVRLCTEFATKDGMTVREVYSDFAISGAMAINRQALQRMLRDARASRFDVVISESLDRLSRGQKDTADIFERMRFLGIRIVTVSEGEISELHVGLKGTMNALFLKDLAAKTSRGMRGNAEAGEHTGGRVYGYRSRRELNANGTTARVWLEIDEAQAAVIRRIFAERAAGRAVRQIVRGLNADGIPSPSGGEWRASTVHGSRARANGILRNHLYAGRKPYRKESYIKDPETGRRVTRINPAEAWLWYERPELRIVDPETWTVVQAKHDRDSAAPARNPGRQPKRLFSGLMVCGACGGPMGAVGNSRHGKPRVGCLRNRSARTCTNTKSLTAGPLEARILAGLKANLLAPDVIEAVCSAYNSERRRLAATAGQRTSAIEKRLAGVNRAISGLVQAIENGAFSPAIRDRLNGLEREKADLEADRAAVDRPGVVRLHPGIADRYRELVGRLEETVNDGGMDAQDRDIVRGMIDRIVIHPLDGMGKISIELVGSLVQLFETAQAANDRCAVSRKTVVAGGSRHRNSTPRQVACAITVWV